MRSRRDTAPNPAAQPIPDDDGYRDLPVDAILSDLPSLDGEQLLLVKSLEEAGERRPAVLDRIETLLVVQEATRHLRAVATPAPTPAPIPDALPAPGDSVSSDLLDQMGGLLAKDAARRTELQSAWPLPDLGQRVAGDLPAEAVPSFWPEEADPHPRRSKKGKAKDRKSGRSRSAKTPKHATPETTGAPEATVIPIVPSPPTPVTGTKSATITPLRGGKNYVTPPTAEPTTVATTTAPAPRIVDVLPLRRRRSDRNRSDRRRSPRGRALKVLAGVVIVALVGGGGFAAWNETHHEASAAPPSGLAGLLITAVPGGYSRAPDSQVNATVVPGSGWVASDTRLWTNDGGQEDVSVALSQFHTGTQAATDAKLSASLTGTKVGAAATAPASSTRESGSTVVMTRGSYEIVVTAHGPAVKAAREANLVALAQVHALAG